jgi:hypothetical protein
VVDVVRGREAINDHYRVLDALERRDEELAEIMMRRHIAATRLSYEAIIAERKLILDDLETGNGAASQSGEARKRFATLRELHEKAQKED